MEGEPFKLYTAAQIQAEVLSRAVELFAPYAEDRPPNWSVDSRTRDTICIMAWLRKELASLELGDLPRITQEWEFNRVSRSDFDLFESAAKVMNDTLAGRYDVNRKPHRRWG